MGGRTNRIFTARRRGRQGGSGGFISPSAAGAVGGGSDSARAVVEVSSVAVSGVAGAVGDDRARSAQRGRSRSARSPSRRLRPFPPARWAARSAGRPGWPWPRPDARRRCPGRRETYAPTLRPSRSCNWFRPAAGASALRSSPAPVRDWGLRPAPPPAPRRGIPG